nr:hypothetical protein [Candidatus Njordarchaeota archaeon]
MSLSFSSISKVSIKPIFTKPTKKMNNIKKLRDKQASTGLIGIDESSEAETKEIALRGKVGPDKR